jgi:phage baseplate assembly protein V
VIDAIRREIKRHAAQARHALRAISTGLQIATRIQRASAEGLASEQLQDVELFQHFGFTSAPPDGSQLIVIPLGGRTSASVIVATEHGAHRFVLDAKGEMAVYNQWGDFIHLRQDRKIHVKAAVEVQVEAPLATFSADVHVTGTLTADVDVVTGTVHLKTHKHSGVSAGGAQSGGPV